MGAECASASECLGNECLEGAMDSPICTRQCSGKRAACPDGWHCEAVDGVDVCAPIEPEVIVPGGGGCACRGMATSAHGSGRAAMFALLALLVVRVRSVHTSRRRQGVLT